MPKGLVALHSASGTDEQLEAVIKAIADLAGGHQRNARRRQLDRQRDSVKAPADLGDCTVEGGTRCYTMGTFNE
jgi:hypothetical protein